MRWIWIGAVAIRVLAAIGLLMYPRVSDSDLTGWDAERFQEIAEIDGRPWADAPVEYPPGTVLLAQAIVDDTPAGTNDRLVVLSLGIDLMVAAILRRRWTATAAVAYLAIGVPLVPAGLLRFDLWAVLAAVLALSELRKPSSRARDLRFGWWAVIGAMIKVWPVLVVAAALAVRQTRAAVVAIVMGVASGVAWFAYAGLDAPQQVLSLRGASGWQLETIGGSLTGLFTDAEVTLQNDAYRIGTLSPTLVLTGRLVALASITAVTILARRGVTGDRRAANSAASAIDGPTPAPIPAMVMLAATAALIVTAPLLSPQFLLWLTPFAAICWPSRPAVAATAAITITGLTGPIFGYEHLADPLPAVILLGRDVLLIGVVVTVCMRLMSSSQLAEPPNQS